VASDVVETPEDVAATIRAALAHVPADRLFPCTNCGMAPMASEIAYAKLTALAAGAEMARKAMSGPRNTSAPRAKARKSDNRL